MLNKTKIRRLFRKWSPVKRMTRLLRQSEVRVYFQILSAFSRRLFTIGIPFLTLTIFAGLIYEVGYNEFYSPKIWFYTFWKWVFHLLFVLYCIRIVFLYTEIKWRARIFNVLVALLILAMSYLITQVLLLHPRNNGSNFTLDKILLYAGTIFLFVLEGSYAVKGIYKKIINPALLFVASFFLLIMVGAFLLMLPNATVHGISPIDAWFTSASAVCVTGLIVVDTATAFTAFGKIIIIALIQIGGLGVMTFAGLLTYLATGSVSYANQLALKDILSSNRMTDVVGLVTRVITVTLTFEVLGAILVYLTLSDTFIAERSDRFLFSVFHSISAFCNAGFSTLTDGLYDVRLRTNYTMHLIIASLVILGGLGFPIVFNLARYLQNRVINFFLKALRIPGREFSQPVIHTSARLSLFTTVLLLFLGFIAYITIEMNASLQEHPTVIGKIVTSFFASVTPRTAGFNTVDLTTLRLPTIMIYLLLMWIGASPGSTGGGIKTTVAAVAFLNMRAVLLGKTRIEVFRTQISESTMRRAFAVVLASLLVIGVAILLVSFQDADKSLIKVAFEVFSAYSTVGLTLGITAKLSAFSKLVLSIVMLIGRVGTLTLFFALITPVREVNYRYPSEDILL